MEKIALPVIICCMLFSAQDLWAQEFGLQTTPNPKISTYVDMLNDERVTGPFYGPVKSIRTSSNYYGYPILLSRDVHKGKQEMARHIESDQSEYSFSKNGNLSSLQVNYKLKVDYFTYIYDRMSDKTWGELQDEKNWSSKLFDGTVSYKFQNGKLTERKDTANGDMKKELVSYDSLGRVVSCYVISGRTFRNIYGTTHASYDCFSYNADGLLNRHYRTTIDGTDTSYSGLEYFVYSKNLITKRFIYRKSIYTFIENQPVYRHYFYLSVLDYDTLSNGNTVSDTRVLFYEMNLSEEEERRVYFDEDLVNSLIDSVYEKGETYVWREDRCRTRDVWTIPYNRGCCTYDSLNRITRWNNDYKGNFGRVENTLATMRYDEEGRLVEAVAEGGIFKQTLLDWQKKVVRQKAEYDDYGNLLLFEWYEKDQSEPSDQRRYEYEYDAYGNWISRKCYLDGELKSDEKREIVYW